MATGTVGKLSLRQTSIRLDPSYRQRCSTTARAWQLKEAFGHFWKYKAVLWASGFLDAWCQRAMRGRLEPMKKMARMLRAHEELPMNWFRSRGELSSAAVEGFNNKVRVVTRRSYEFHIYNGIEAALYRTLGRLPESETAHRFCRRGQICLARVRRRCHPSFLRGSIGPFFCNPAMPTRHT